MARKWLRWLPTLVLALALPSCACAALYTLSDGAVISDKVVEEQTYLFLPAYADAAAITPTPPDTVTVMQSANIATLYLTSDDPINEGREWLEARRARAIETTGHMRLVNADGSVVYDDDLRQIRGRGNTTWDWGDKKPYQIKLEQKTDLLETGDSRNRARTWLLIADAFDASHLHNAITLDLGQAMGLSETPQYRFVDLYYDGDHRGLYLLSEKVEIDEGRLEITDLTKAIEWFYPAVEDETLFAHVQAEDATGQTYQYVDNIDVSFEERGAYLIERDMYHFEYGVSWFHTRNGAPYEIQSPKYVSETDLLWLQGFMQQVEDTIDNGGVHPENGRSIDTYIDLPSFARYYLVQQYAKTADFGYTSTYMYIPEGEAKLYAGPLWDFDVAYAMRDTRLYEGGTEGYVPQEGLFYRLMLMPAFQEVYKELFESELLPLIENTLLGDEPNAYLRSINDYLSWIEPARAINDVFWEQGGHYNNINRKTLYATYEENRDYFLNYLTERIAWMKADVKEWAGYEITLAPVRVSYRNANITEYATVEVSNPYANCVLTDKSWQSEKDEAEPWHTRYTVTFTLEAQRGSTFGDPVTVEVNGCEVPVIAQSESELTAAFTFIGPTYESAIYEDIDYGLVFNAAYYAHVDEYAYEDCGDDPEALLEYYVYYGIGDGMSAIETFDVEWLCQNYSKLMDSYYGYDPLGCTQHYIDHAYDENLLALEADVVPEAVGE